MDLLPAELEKIIADLDAADRDARALVDGLDEAGGTWRQAPGRWSVAECLDHLAVANRVYLAAMSGPAEDARAKRRMRRGPARPGILGGLFVRSLEPPVRVKTPNPRLIVPRTSPPLDDAFRAFLASQEQVRAFVRKVADLDLAGVMFPNPFIGGLRWSLATGLHVIPAHDRRHLWQAWNVRRARSKSE